MSPAPVTRGSVATSDNANIIGPNDRYVASDPQAVEQPTSGEVYFRFMVDCAIDQGYITPEGASHVLNALYPEVQP
jgi:hypothetical protein